MSQESGRDPYSSHLRQREIIGSLLLQSTLMEPKLLLVPWAVAVLYSSIPLFWFAVHPFADSWRRMKCSPYRAILPIWAVIIIVLGGITWPWRTRQLYSTPWAWVPALLLFSLGLQIYRRIFPLFGGHRLSGEAELRPAEHEQELITTGLHEHMRHPIYVAHLVNLAGWTLGSGLLVDILLLAVATLVTFPLMILIEERELEERFGARFREYKARVPLVAIRGFRSIAHAARTRL